MTTRQLEFITGVETSTQPASQDPSNDGDLITKGFADKNYVQGTATRDSINDVKAIPDTERKDGDRVFVKNNEIEFYFDDASSLPGDDDLVLVPDSGTGRWLQITVRNKQLNLTDTTNSTDKDTGAIVTEGGVGIEKDLSVGGTLRVDGSATINNLTTTGSTTFANSTEVEIFDAKVTYNKDGTQGTADLNEAGFEVDMNDATNAGIGYNSALASKFNVGEDGSRSEIVSTGSDQSVTGLKKFEKEIELEAITTPIANPSTGLKLYAKSDDNLYTKNSAGAEVQVGTGASGGGANIVGLVQFLALDFETSVASALPYDDGAPTPIDGTGAGGAGLTASLETVSPIVGDGSLRVVKDAVNRQGQGRRFDFEIDGGNSFKSTLLPLNFLWRTDASYVDNDVGVFIYDVDNAELLNNGEAYITLPQSIEETRINLSWISSDSDNYRVLFHTLSTNASSYTWFVDNLVSEFQPVNKGFDGIWKTYYHGTDFTLTSDASATVSFIRGELTPKKDTKGNWYISGKIALTHGSDTAFDVSIPGVTFKNVTNFFQPITTGDPTARARATPNTGNIEVDYNASASLTALTLSDIELESKPTWADFDPIATVYPTTDDLALGDWVTFTPLWDNPPTSGYTYDSQRYRRLGTSYEIDINVSGSGSNGGDLNLNWPSSISYSPDLQDGQLTHMGHLIKETTTTFERRVYGVYVTANEHFELYIDDASGGLSRLTSGSTIARTLEIKVSIPVADADLGRIPPIGLQVAKGGSPGLINYYEETTLDADGDFTGGTFEVTRIGNLVTITSRGVTHSSASGPGSSIGLVPAWARPSSTTYSVTLIGTTTQTRMSVNSLGTIAYAYLNTSFASTTATSATDGSISYVVED